MRPMRILVFGNLGPYPERILTFAERGHKLWYVCTLWISPGERAWLESAGIRTVHLYDLGTSDNWPHAAVEQVLEMIKRERVEVVYSLLNVWDRSNQATATLLRMGCPVPVIRHYKEHYVSGNEDERTCLEGSAGAIFINPESRDYFASVYALPERTACIDADLIPRRYLAGKLQPKLSATDNVPHLLLGGTATEDGGRYDYRGLIRELIQCGAHVHLYGQFKRMQPNGEMHISRDVETAYREIKGAAESLHIYEPIPPERFVEEWSRYDVGLLHVPRPDDLFRSQNLPNRYSAYIAAGLPVAVQNGEMAAMQRQLESLGAAIVYHGPADLVRQLPNAEAVANAVAARESVTFEATYPELERFIYSFCE